MQIATETDFVSTLRDIYLSDQVDLVFSIQYSVFPLRYQVSLISVDFQKHLNPGVSTATGCEDGWKSHCGLKVPSAGLSGTI